LRRLPRRPSSLSNRVVKPVAPWLAVVTLLAPARPAQSQDFDQPPAPAQSPAPHVPALTRAPMVKKDPTPIYPPDALAAGLTADVSLSVEIDALGHVTNAAVTRSAGPSFDQSALAAVRAMEFNPAEIDGRPAPITIEYILHFRPTTASDAAAAPDTPDGGVPDTEAPSGRQRPPGPGSQAFQPLPPTLILRGRIRERGTREPIAGAAVSIITTDGGGRGAGGDSRAREVATSDGRGQFEITLAMDRDTPYGGDVRHGLRVVVTESGHETCIRDLTPAELVGTSVAPIDWSCFTPRTATILETQVRAARASPDITRRTLSQPELTSVPGTYGDPLRVIQNLPGVARAPYGLGLLVVRGAPPTDTGVFVSGQGIPQLYHFLVGPSVVAPHLIERVDFYPGGFGVRYGRASGGAVDVILKETPAEQLHGGVDISVLDVSVFAEGPLRPNHPGTSATVAVRRSTLDAILPHVIPSRRGSTYVTAVPIYWDYQARVVQELGGWGRAGVMAFGSDDALKVVSQDPQAGDFALDTHTSFHRVVGFWTGQLAGWTARVAPAYGNGEDSFQLSSGGGFIRYQRAYLRADFSHAIGPRLEAHLGLDGLFSYDTAYFDFWFPREGRNFGTATPERIQTGRGLVDWGPAVFVEGVWRPTEGLKVVPGLRFDYFHVIDTDKVSFDPRLAVRWQPGETWTVKAGAGLYHQLPVGQLLDREFGNPNLALIWTDQYHMGIERPLTRSLMLDATAYLLRRHDLPIPSAEHFSSTGRGRGWGLEFWLKHDVTAHFFGWLAYTLSWSEQTGSSAEEMLTGTAATTTGRAGTSTYHASPFDQRHNLIAIASYRRWGWQFGARYRLVSGRPTALVTGSFYDADFGGYSPQTVSASGRLPTFNQLDIRIEKTFTFDYWTLGIYLDVQNIFNRENAENFVYDYRFRQGAPVRGLPILPVVGVRGRF
jgi:TonB family protein